MMVGAFNRLADIAKRAVVFFFPLFFQQAPVSECVGDVRSKRSRVKSDTANRAGDSLMMISFLYFRLGLLNRGS